MRVASNVLDLNRPSWNERAIANDVFLFAADLSRLILEFELNIHLSSGGDLSSRYHLCRDDLSPKDVSRLEQANDAHNNQEDCESRCKSPRPVESVGTDLNWVYRACIKHRVLQLDVGVRVNGHESGWFKKTCQLSSGFDVGFVQIAPNW